MHDQTSRRDAIKVIGATAAGLLVGGGGAAAQVALNHMGLETPRREAASG